ncbi:Cytochrome p450 [Thalictrum thalictroides]|uniref:Cytochrome p450 n=1 Tax=Thalictrum thalictroides TaxID=46969 RepID=A0A7J6WV82_THATH|nr:Cytochrome p450 [Thalictrum thalictroides]
MELDRLLTCLAACSSCLFFYLLDIRKQNYFLQYIQKLHHLFRVAWPIIGHLHMLMGKELPHLLLWKLAGKYGPAFMLKYGSQSVIVISSLKLAKECFIHNDRAVFKRPNS